MSEPAAETLYQRAVRLRLAMAPPEPKREARFPSRPLDAELPRHPRHGKAYVKGKRCGRAP